MCGICGTYKTNIDIETAIKKLHHRGPDSHGIKHADGVTQLSRKTRTQNENPHQLDIPIAQHRSKL